jgi:competence/damage-inducible protein CinA-like protein
VIQDTNTSFIARTLNDSGIDIYHTSMIGDNKERIAREIQAALKRADIIITTGGLGPTIDDPTRNAVALAFNRSTEYRPELWEQIKERFKAYGREPSENNKRQAFIPQGATAITNPVGTAPAFSIEADGKIVFSLPGVPSEMKTLLINDVMPIIKSKYGTNEIIMIRTIHTVGIGESVVDELVAEFEIMHNPTVGLSAHPGQVDIRITAKARDAEHAEFLIKPVEIQITKLLGDYVYGEDDTTLESVVLDELKSHEINVILFYDKRFSEIADSLTIWLELDERAKNIIQSDQVRLPLSSMYNQSKEKELTLIINIHENVPNGIVIYVTFLGESFTRSLNYGGHPSHFNQWAGNYILNFLREILKKKKEIK